MKQKDTSNSISAKQLVSCGNCKVSPRVNASPFMRCGLCKQISYCCKECQTVDWQRHKAKCKTDRDKRTKHASCFEIANRINSSSAILSEADFFKKIENMI